jgi:hypothetical protein
MKQVQALIRVTLGLAALSPAMLTGCASKYAAVTPEVQSTMMRDLQAGKPVLDCGQNCRFTWAGQVGAIHQLDLAENWNDLALRVMQVGYGSDLAYYYLGQAAQGLGYHQAAITYYGLSMALNTGSNAMLKCASGQALAAQLQLQTGDPCEGVDLAASIPVLIQASRDALAQQAAADAAAQQAAASPPPPVHHHHVQSASTNKASGATNTGGTGWAVPPPAPSSASASNAPTSNTGGSNTGGTGWAVPPPASPASP